MVANVRSRIFRYGVTAALFCCALTLFVVTARAYFPGGEAGAAASSGGAKSATGSAPLDTGTATSTATAEPCYLAGVIVASPNVGSNSNYLNGVAAVSSNDVWTVGDYSNGGGNTTQTLTVHYSLACVTPTLPAPLQPPVLQREPLHLRAPAPLQPLVQPPTPLQLLAP